MGALAAFVRLIDGINEWVGRGVAWLAPLCVLTCFGVVVLRYGFGTGAIWMQELYVWMHAGLFLLGAGYTLKHGGHVRVDAIYARLSPRAQAWIDIAGVLLFLLPWLVILTVLGWQFTASSLRVDESSSQPGGMPNLWLLKAAIPLAAVLLGAQGLALLGRRVLEMAGHPGFALHRHEREREERIVG